MIWLGWSDLTLRNDRHMYKKFSLVATIQEESKNVAASVTVPDQA